MSSEKFAGMEKESVEVFIDRLSFLARYVEIHYLGANDEPLVLEFNPRQSVFQVWPSELLRVAHPINGKLEISVVWLRKMLYTKIYGCRGCSKCAGEGGGTFWQVDPEGTRLEFYQRAWGRWEI